MFLMFFKIMCVGENEKSLIAGGAIKLCAWSG